MAGPRAADPRLDDDRVLLDDDGGLLIVLTPEG